MSAETTSKNLSVRLLRVGKKIEDALRDGHDLTEHPAIDGRLFVSQSVATPPTWYGFVGKFARRALPNLTTQSCGAALFLDVPLNAKGTKARTVAISFGGGFHALELDAFEKGFGLRVVLNAVAASNLRVMDVATLDATTFLRRIQASRDADLRGFGIDIQRDLLRLAAGSPKDPTFARSLAGKDALTMSATIAADAVIKKCKKAIELFRAEDYKRDFGFIDYVAPVRDRALLDRLDSLAFDELRKLVKDDPSDLHLSLPDIISPEAEWEIGYFGAGLKSGAKTPYGQLTIEDYVAELQAGKFDEIADMAQLRATHEVRVIADGEGSKKHRRKLYECLVWEVTYRGRVYVLFSGDWFAVDKKFYKMVEADYATLLSSTPFVPKTSCANEREFIAELDKSNKFLNLDQVKLAPSGMPGANIEPCDFLSTKRQLIHLKDGHGSAPISHLWNQGVVSAEAFVRDAKFRKDLREAVKKRQVKARKIGFEALVPDARTKLNPAEYTIVFGIMRSRHQRTDALSIPFFSKISVRAISERIRLMGFGVEIHLVEKV